MRARDNMTQRQVALLGLTSLLYYIPDKNVAGAVLRFGLKVYTTVYILPSSRDEV